MTKTMTIPNADNAPRRSHDKFDKRWQEGSKDIVAHKPSASNVIPTTMVGESRDGGMLKAGQGIDVSHRHHHTCNMTVNSGLRQSCVFSLCMAIQAPFITKLSEYTPSS
jgi:hypothetical protein